MVPEQITTNGGDSDFQELVERCSQLSSYELCRLQAAVDVMIDDPQRIKHLKRLVHAGDQIEYFASEKNRCVPAVVEACRRTKVTVKNLDDGQRWSISYTCINVDGRDVTLPASSGSKLSRAELAIGDTVGFHDKHGFEHAGVVVKLNPKTAGLDCDGNSWRVGYGLLFHILDANTQTIAQKQLLLESDMPQASIDYSEEKPKH